MIQFRKFLPFLLYSCRRVSAIISINPKERSQKEKVILAYHKAICKACHNYQYQNDMIEESLSNFKHNTIKLSDEKKAEIISSIKKAI
jgi:hypothetical protein